MLANSPSTKSLKEQLKQAPIPVIKLLCNIANQVLHNPKYKITKFPPEIQAALHRHKKLIEKLCDRKNKVKSIQQSLIQQRGGLHPIIPILLTTAIATFGPLIFDAIASRFKKQ